MKRGIRGEILEKRNAMDTSEFLEKSNRAISNLFSTECYKKADTVCSFISFGSELNTHGLIKMMLLDGKRVVVPYVKNREMREMILSELKSWDELDAGEYGILAPKKEFIREVSPKEVDLFLVPGVAFDPEGHRVGYGGGYYDRLLRELETECLIGLCFELQIVDKVPRAAHDVAVKRIITEERIIEADPQPI